MAVIYAGLLSQGEAVPIAVKSHNRINRDALQFLSVSRCSIAAIWLELIMTKKNISRRHSKTSRYGNSAHRKTSLTKSV